jgi:hypothetical protein
LKIRAAFPNILKRQYPFVKPDYPLLTVLYLLRMNEVDAVPLEPEEGKENRAVFGFSSLPKFMSLAPKRFAHLLKEPCARASDELATFGMDADLEDVLDAFASKRLGFAFVHGAGARSGRNSLITLGDFLEMYGKNTLSSDLLVRDVASSMLVVPDSTTIRSALQTMFRNRYRRVFVSERECVSERNVMQYVFSPLILEELGAGTGRDLMATPISRLGRSRPTVVPPYADLRTSALKLRGGMGRCLIVGSGKLASPWDVVMKPWKSGRLRFG